MTAWQPIDTAPRDGTPILLQPGDFREWCFIGHWGHVGRYTSSPKMWIGHEYGAMENGISHWMPLPQPPESDSK